MRSTILRRCFLCLFVLLPVQFGAAKLCEYVYGVEMWPAVLSPSFARVYDRDDAVEVPHPQASVTFTDGRTEAVPVRRLLADLPASHRRSVMRGQFSHDYGLEDGTAPAPATARWLAGRLRALYPEREPRSFAVRWVRSYYRREDGALRQMRTAAFDSVSVALASRPQAPLVR